MANARRPSIALNQHRHFVEYWREEETRIVLCNRILESVYSGIYVSSITEGI
jgi:hypothetical protein